MTRLVIARVEELAASQGYKTLKFFNRKKQEVILQDIDLILEGEGSNQLYLRGDELNLPSQDEIPGKLLSNDNESLDVDENVAPLEVADLVKDMRMNDEAIIPDDMQHDDENLDGNHEFYSDQDNSE